MKNLKFNANEMLGRTELKSILGGEGPVFYDPNDPCQNYTELAPTGCPCPTSIYLDCASRICIDGICG